MCTLFRCCLFANKLFLFCNIEIVTHQYEGFDVFKALYYPIERYLKRIIIWISTTEGIVLN